MEYCAMKCVVCCVCCMCLFMYVYIMCNMGAWSTGIYTHIHWRPHISLNEYIASPVPELSCENHPCGCSPCLSCISDERRTVWSDIWILDILLLGLFYICTQSYTHTLLTRKPICTCSSFIQYIYIHIYSTYVHIMYYIKMR